MRASRALLRESREQLHGLRRYSGGSRLRRVGARIISHLPLSSGTRLGVYEIIAAIGEGGMGQVFRARDTRLDRDVAIKILPEAFAHDADRLARFQREARTLASLNHPNIAAIYDLEESGGMIALVMEFVEGDDLSQRIGRGRIPLDEALPIAKQIADALEAAHEQSIVHRDLKPANVKVRADGTVKVLDFGLAKAMEPIATSDSAHLPTITSPAMTRQGVILGTAAYMSTEQARGKPADKRADIWAFGCVLYEMLAGRRAFEGDDISITLANVLKEDLKWDALPRDLPASVYRLLRRCVEKDPKRRLSSISDARLELDEPAEPGTGPRSDGASPVLSRTRERLAWAALVIIAAVLAPLTVKRLAGSAPEPAVTRFELPLSARTVELGRPEVSPDGRTIAVAVPGDDGIARIRIRPLDTATFQELPGTEGATYPFWSPDSRSIAFFANDTLERIPVAGGPPQILCAAIRARGGTWGRAGIVLFSAIADHAERLQQVAESGGTPDVLTPLSLPKLTLQRWPHFLPDGRHFLFFASARQTETDGVYAASLGETGAKRIVGGFGEARYSDGTLVFVRDTTLMAQPFDATSQVLGPADPVVISSVSNAGNEGSKAFAVSDAGVLIVVPFSAPLRFQLKWFDRGGRWIADLGVPGNQRGPRISPDGFQVVTWSATAPAANRGGALWIIDAKSGRPQRLTFTDGFYSAPVWSRDATSVFFGLRTGATGISDLFSEPTNGSASQEALLPSREKENKFPLDASFDGRSLLYTTQSTTSPNGLWVLSLPERTPSLYVRNAGLARLSPGGHWVAYAGNDSGHSEIYVQSFPTPATKFQITEGGGDAPVWSRDGRELFYVAGARVMAVPVSMTNGHPSIGQPTALFDLPGQPDFDVSADGRFLFAVPIANQAPAAVVTLNWKAGLKK